MKVRCINNFVGDGGSTGLNVGEVYEVIQADYPNMYEIPGMGGYYKSRFEVVEEEKTFRVRCIDAKAPTSTSPFLKEGETYQAKEVSEDPFWIEIMGPYGYVPFAAKRFVEEQPRKFRVRCIDAKSDGVGSILLTEGETYQALENNPPWIDIMGPYGYVSFHADRFVEIITVRCIDDSNCEFLQAGKLYSATLENGYLIVDADDGVSFSEGCEPFRYRRFIIFTERFTTSLNMASVDSSVGAGRLCQ